MRDRWYAQAGDYCVKTVGGVTWTGRVETARSQRTGRDYLRVRILSGPKRGCFEFHDRDGWSEDDGSYGGNERPALSSRDAEVDTVGDHMRMTAHHALRRDE
jgi:hypothetical protein